MVLEAQVAELKRELAEQAEMSGIIFALLFFKHRSYLED